LRALVTVAASGLAATCDDGGLVAGRCSWGPFGWTAEAPPCATRLRRSRADEPIGYRLTEKALAYLFGKGAA
jgi:hypothetical protein